MPWKESKVVEERLKFIMETEKGEQPFRTIRQN